ncbi:hypothetical protein A2U01_0093979 [Trifolium medium]|uniref:Uncharacterized protein n=1 Tax=Trifolium medium TaxID=97028 RepID=A0A392ULT8_9FABA|nr:hypothetical protein [Trifolium medium]
MWSKPALSSFKCYLDYATFFDPSCFGMGICSETAMVALCLSAHFMVSICCNCTRRTAFALLTGIHLAM